MGGRMVHPGWGRWLKVKSGDRQIQSSSIANAAKHSLPLQPFAIIIVASLIQTHKYKHKTQIQTQKRYMEHKNTNTQIQKQRYKHIQICQSAEEEL